MSDDTQIKTNEEEAQDNPENQVITDEAFIARLKETLDTMKEGKGVLKLEHPITSGDEKIQELPYDFNQITGMEYADAMDTDANSTQAYRITYRQGLALFAMAAAKQTERLDMRDIMDRLGITDAVEGVQLATLFFNASTRAGQMRISKKS